MTSALGSTHNKRTPVPMLRRLTCSLHGCTPGTRTAPGRSSRIWNQGYLVSKLWLPAPGKHSSLLHASAPHLARSVSYSSAVAAAATLSGTDTQGVHRAMHSPSLLRHPLAPHRWAHRSSSPYQPGSLTGRLDRAYGTQSIARAEARGGVEGPRGIITPVNAFLEGLSEEQRDAVEAGPGHVRCVRSHPKLCI